jgi:hypothetical protein
MQCSLCSSVHNHNCTNTMSKHMSQSLYMQRLCICIVCKCEYKFRAVHCDAFSSVKIKHTCYLLPAYVHCCCCCCCVPQKHSIKRLSCLSVTTAVCPWRRASACQPPYTQLVLRCGSTAARLCPVSLCRALHTVLLLEALLSLYAAVCKSHASSN